MTEKELQNYLLPVRLRGKDGYWHMLIESKHPITKEIIRHSESTKIRIIGKNQAETKNNKINASAKLLEFQKKWSDYHFKGVQEMTNDILFTDYLSNWLYSMKATVEPYTFKNYKMIVEKSIIPYFNPKKLLLTDLKAIHIQEFYSYCLNEKKLSQNTVIRFHANIRKCLQTALKQELVLSNQADLVDKPKKKRYIAQVLSPSEIHDIFEEIKGTHLALPTFLTMYYGLRRSEALGLLWSNVDFENNLLKIDNTLVEGEHREIYNRKSTKNKTSHRILPLIPEVNEFLKQLKIRQKENKEYFKNSYNQNFLDNICVKENGDIIKPGYVTQKFTKITRKLGYTNVHFHCLRHSFATNMYLGGVNLNMVKELLGHSCLNTTVEIYTHLPKEVTMKIGRKFISEIMTKKIKEKGEEKTIEEKKK